MTDSIPRLSFNQLPAAIAERLQPKYQRLGYLGEFFAATAHQADALAAFIDFTDAAKGGLDIRIVELIALTVSVMKQVDYERNQHERLAVKLGFGADWVAEVERLAPDDADLGSLERAVQRLVIAAVRNDGHGVTAELEQVVDALGPADAVAVLMVMARYTTHAMLVNCLAIEAPVESIFPRDAAAPESRKPQ
ncbi:MAG: carboxymuconolactone decarboxylase family protein [Pseudomonadales bacterium]